MQNMDLSGPAWLCAPQLLGMKLVRTINGHKLAGRIVEVEAYDQSDAASHSYRGETPRTKAMFGEPGHAYVYFTYGMHYCMNVVTGPKGRGSAVLIRALEPLEGVVIMAQNRKYKKELTNGPARLCEALKIDTSLNGHNLADIPLQLLPDDVVPAQNIVATTRVGISRDKHRKWRFCIKGNPFVSK